MYNAPYVSSLVVSNAAATASTVSTGLVNPALSAPYSLLVIDSVYASGNTASAALTAEIIVTSSGGTFTIGGAGAASTSGFGIACEPPNGIPLWTLSGGASTTAPSTSNSVACNLNGGTANLKITVVYHFERPAERQN